MAGNRLLGRQKVFFNQILIYTSLLNVFLKNRKKIDFFDFLSRFPAKFWPIFNFSGQISAKRFFSGVWIPRSFLEKKMLPVVKYEISAF